MSRFASLCFLSYERQEFLQQAIESAIRTAEFPMEIIVHDDGSKDPSVRAYLRHLIDSGKISALIENPPGHNQGVGVAMNRTFQIAKGDPIIKLDQDLIFHPGWLRRSVEILERNWMCLGEEEVNREPTIGALGLFRYPVEPVRYEDMFTIRDHAYWEEHEDFVGSAMVIPRWIWEEYGPFEERSAAFAEDITFKKLLQSKGYSMALPKTDDFVTNQGFGLGPSTVVVQKDNGELTSRDIHTAPPLVEVPEG